MKGLSLFDGMACGMLAMQKAGIEVERYVAYEIDKYAVQTSSHNFPMIEQRGDVFKADFTEFQGFDFLIGGSPCTYWSIAQKNNRETEASGMGWELFSQYVRALHEAKPRFFVYENNKSMSNAIRESITKAFGFEPICINSARVSAQNRQRLYWVGKRNEDGTYSKANIEQPEDRCILLKDVLESATTSNESLCLDPVACRCRGRVGKDGIPYAKYECREDGKANTLDTNTTNGAMVAEPLRVGGVPRPNGELSTSQAFRVYSTEGKSVNLTAQGGGAGAKTGLYAVPVGVGYRNRREDDGKLYRRFETHNEEKSNAITTVQTDSMVAEPCWCYATPCEFDEEGKPVKAISVADGKTYTVYEVNDGKITIKGKQYPIKLPDGYYIIRKLTVRECMRLQTVPEWYEFPVSDSQAYKMLGNGWTVDVIVHILSGLKEAEEHTASENPVLHPVTCGEIILALRKFADGECDEYKRLIFAEAADKVERMAEVCT